MVLITSLFSFSTYCYAYCSAGGMEADRSCDTIVHCGTMMNQPTLATAIVMAPQSGEDSSTFRHLTNKDQANLITLDDKMTALISLQNANGMFALSGDGWNESVFELYVGKLEEVKSACPKHIGFDLWTTALAIKIMELKMGEKRELWELVAEKGKQYLLSQLANGEHQYNTLLEEAERYMIGA